MGQYYGPKALEHYAMALWYPSQWLHSEWTEEKQKAFNEMYNFQIPFIGYYPYRNQFDSILDSDSDAAYMWRYGIGYGDVKDPRKLSQSRHGVIGSSINFVSSNIKHLYK